VKTESEGEILDTNPKLPPAINIFQPLKNWAESANFGRNEGVVTPNLADFS